MPTRLITIKLEEDLLEQLDDFCRKNHISRSLAIKQGILRILKEGIEIK